MGGSTIRAGLSRRGRWQDATVTNMGRVVQGEAGIEQDAGETKIEEEADTDRDERNGLKGSWRSECNANPPRP